MTPETNTNPQQENERMPAAPSGNASNPSANNVPEGEDNQLLGHRAEKYLRESASIEDMPDDQDWQDADEVLKGGDQQGSTSGDHQAPQ